MVELIIENEQDKEEITPEIERLTAKVCDVVMMFEKCGFDAEISFTFTDDEKIRIINKEHRGIDRATDVLSFPMLDFDDKENLYEAEFDDIEFNLEMDGKLVMLGDIVINAQRARSQSEEYGHSFKREIAFLTAHSMLHLLGYDHVGSEEEDRIMREKQNAVLNYLNIKR